MNKCAVCRHADFQGPWVLPCAQASQICDPTGKGAPSAVGTPIPEEVCISQVSEGVLILHLVEVEMSSFVCSHKTGLLD